MYNFTTLIFTLLENRLFSFWMMLPSISPLSDGIQIHAVLMGGGRHSMPPPPIILENEGTESREG